MKRSALQNERVVVLRMVFRARKVFGTFEKRAPGLAGIYNFALARGDSVCMNDRNRQDFQRSR